MSLHSDQEIKYTRFFHCAQSTKKIVRFLLLLHTHALDRHQDVLYNSNRHTGIPLYLVCRRAHFDYIYYIFTQEALGVC